MSYNDLLHLYFDRSNSLQWYWTIYVVVIGGLLAFSSLRQRPDHRTAILVTVLYCFFAYKNLGAIHDVTEQRFAIYNTIRSVPPNPTNSDSSAMLLHSALEPTLQPPEYAGATGVRNFHVATDVLVVLALWAMERRRLRAATLAQPV